MERTVGCFVVTHGPAIRYYGLGYWAMSKGQPQKLHKPKEAIPLLSGLS